MKPSQIIKGTATAILHRIPFVYFLLNSYNLNSYNYLFLFMLLFFIVSFPDNVNYTSSFPAVFPKRRPDSLAGVAEWTECPPANPKGLRFSSQPGQMLGLQAR